MSRAQTISNALQGAWCEAFQSLPSTSSSASSSSSVSASATTRRHISEAIAQSIDVLLTTNELQGSPAVEATVSLPSNRLLDCLNWTEFAVALQLHAQSNATSGIEYEFVFLSAFQSAYFCVMFGRANILSV
jgi:hypothetical protein